MNKAKRVSKRVTYDAYPERMPLARLSDRMVERVMEYPGGFFRSTRLAKDLDVERRRLYDVLGVWEGMGLAKRMRVRSSWEWIGHEGLASLCARIRFGLSGSGGFFEIYPGTHLQECSAWGAMAFCAAGDEAGTRQSPVASDRWHMLRARASRLHIQDATQCGWLVQTGFPSVSH